VRVIYQRVYDKQAEVRPWQYATVAPARRTVLRRIVQRESWYWQAGLILWSAVCVLAIAMVFTYSRLGGSALAELFLPTMACVFALPAWRLLDPVVLRGERIVIVCLVGMVCYSIKVVCNPVYFVYYDEFLHWRTTDDILEKQHLFHFNALLPVSAYYPGLEVITSALSLLSGLSVFQSGLLVIAVARLVTILSLFLLTERLLQSSRGGSLAVLFYMANSHFMLFDAQYSYESLALPFILLLLVLMEPHQSLAQRIGCLQPMCVCVPFLRTQRSILKDNQRMIIVSTGLVIIALTFTHHATDFFFDSMLVLWAIIWIARPSSPRRTYLLYMTVFALCLSGIAMMRTENPVVGYLWSFIDKAIQELNAIVHGSSARPLFVSYAGPPSPLWERLFTFLSVLCITAMLPFGLWSMFCQHRLNALTVVCCVLALCYPVSQIFRLTVSGADLTNRLSAFLFIPIAMVLAMFIKQFFPVGILSVCRRMFVAGLMTFIFLGGIILGAGTHFALLPGPYQVNADARSIEPEGLEAAKWAAAHLPVGGQVATDRINQILMGTYGKQEIATNIADKIDLSPVFLASQFGSRELMLLRRAHVRYLVVDLRLSQALPLVGFYYEQSEEHAFAHTVTVSATALSKFHYLPGVGRIFDSGDVIIYDVEGVVYEKTQ
jgi:hypothetical protein